MADCYLCGKRAVFRTEEGPLCAEHFSKWYENGVANAISRYSMVNPGDRICVGFSGGKDSTVLLAALCRLNLDCELVAVTVDEGIGGYRDDTILAAKDTALRLGVEHRIVSFKDICGKTLDELLANSPQAACSVCGTLRRRALNAAAREIDADSIATGHCLDDESQSVVMNYLRGDVTRATASFNSNSGDLFIRRIKPLCRSTERATVAYGLCNNLLVPLPECPYTRYALRKDVRTWLGKLEYESPGTLMRIADGQEELLSKMPKAEGEIKILGRCEKCGEPTSNKLCAACQQLERLM
ncbi:MAG: TIGR00269 family protein [Methanocorpusculum sp.]|nr:TIGR00269 family protein [Methanocorpusculum sp.]